MKKLTAVAAAASAMLALAGCSSEDPAVERAGGEEQLRKISDEAQGFCHKMTTYEGTTVQDSPYSPNEFRAIYVEEGGMLVRHVILGEVAFDKPGGGSISAFYECEYIQREKRDAPAVDDNLGIVKEGEAEVAGAGAYLIRDARDDERRRYSVDEASDPVLYVGDYDID